MMEEILDSKKLKELQKRVMKNLKQKKCYIPKDYNDIINNVEITVDINYESSYEEGRLDLFVPKNKDKKLPLVLWIHGGAYVGGDKSRPRNYCYKIASRGFIVANVNYLLAPYGKYPTPIYQVYEALNYLRYNQDLYGIDFDNVFIGGDSAGAQIASQIGAIESNKILAKKMNIKPMLNNSLKGLLLCCGIYNMQTVEDTDFPGIKLFMDIYTDSNNFSTFSRINELSTVENITNNYPNTFLTCGKKDYFINQAKELILLFNHYNVNYTFIEGNGDHECQFHIRKKNALKTFEELINFINKNIDNE